MGLLTVIADKVAPKLDDRERVELAVSLAAEITDEQLLAELVRRVAREQAIRLKGRKVHVAASSVHAGASKVFAALRGAETERARIEVLS